MCSAVKIPVNVLVRPRGGDFLYSDDEMEAIKLDIGVCKDLGVAGVVIGCLRASGHVDTEKTKLLVEAARPMTVTFHRAIDMVCDLDAAVTDLIALGE